MKTYTKLEIYKALKDTYKYLLIHECNGEKGLWNTTMRSFFQNLEKINNGINTDEIKTFENE